MASKKSWKNWLADEQLSLDSFFGSSSNANARQPNVAVAVGRKRKQNHTGAINSPGSSLKKTRVSKEGLGDAELSPAPGSSKRTVLETPAPRRRAFGDTPVANSASSGSKLRDSLTSLRTPVASSSSLSKARMVKGLFTPHPDADKNASGSNKQSAIILSSDDSSNGLASTPGPKSRALPPRPAAALQTPPATMLRPNKLTRMAPPPVPLRIAIPNAADKPQPSDPFGSSPLSSPPPESGDEEDNKLPSLSARIAERDLFETRADSKPLPLQAKVAETVEANDGFHSPQRRHQDQLSDDTYTLSSSPVRNACPSEDARPKNILSSHWEVESSQSQYYLTSHNQSSSPVTSRHAKIDLTMRHAASDFDDISEVPSSQSQYLMYRPSGVATEIPSSQEDHEYEVLSVTPSQCTSSTVAPPPTNSTYPSSAPSSTQMSMTQADTQYSQMARFALPSLEPVRAVGTTVKEIVHRRLGIVSATQASATQPDSQYSQFVRNMLLEDSSQATKTFVNSGTQISATQTDSQYSQFTREAVPVVLAEVGLAREAVRTQYTNKGKLKVDLYACGEEEERESSVAIPESDEEPEEETSTVGPTSIPEPILRPSTPILPLSSPRSSQVELQNSMPAFSSQDDLSMMTQGAMITPRRLQRIVKDYRDSGVIRKSRVGGFAGEEGGGEMCEEVKGFLDIFNDEGESQVMF